MLRATVLLYLALIGVAEFVLGASAGNAHDDPEISVEPNPATVAGTITIEGKEFEENDKIVLTLEGVSGSIALRTVTSDGDGSFHIEVALPSEATPGSYRLRAKGSDAVALADLRITAAPGASQQAAGHEQAIGFHRGGPSEEVIGLSVLIGALAIAGLALALVRERAVR